MLQKADTYFEKGKLTDSRTTLGPIGIGRQFQHFTFPCIKNILQRSFKQF